MADKPSLKLQTGQHQTLVMTPQLQQSIKLLQMASQDLLAYIDQQVMENPFLELEGEAQESDKETAPETPSAQDDVVDYAEKQTLSNDDKGFDAEDATHWQEGASTGSMEEAGYWSKTSAGISGGEGGENLLEQTVARAATLSDHLRDQLQVDIADPQERMIGFYMIDLLDDSGYLHEPLANIAETLGCEVADVEKVLTQLQRFDPCGVFARDLPECLRLQLQEKNHLDPIAEGVLKHLDMLGQGELAKLARLLACGEDDIQDVLADIRSLNPKPGHQFAEGVVQPVTPDVIVRADGKGGWQVYLNSDNLPRVLVNQSYSAHVSGHAKGEEKKYVAEQLQHANWLVKAMNQRAETIMKVATELVKQQDKFLKYGVRYLKPMTLKMVADAIEMHESTVSRVTSNKYVQTPRGLFELKYFFTSGLSAPSALGEEVSSTAVKEQIKRLIEQEDKILSDEKIAQILQKQGIDVARRTVAKYREALGLGSSTERRRAKKLK